MNVFITYLDTMFSAYPKSERLLEAKTELQAMMEDACASMIVEGRSENKAIGQVIRDFGNIDEVAPVLGIASDISPASGDADQGKASASLPQPPVTMEEAQLYADAQESTRFRLSVAVILFVLSPVALISLPVASTSDLLPFTEGTAVFTGVLILLVFAAIGALMFISAARTNAHPKRIAEERFSTNPMVTRWAEALAERPNPRRIRALQIATLLSILSPLPLIGFALFLGDSCQQELWIVSGVVIVLAVVAIALGILLPRMWAHTVADKLTRCAHGRTKTTTARQQPYRSRVYSLKAKTYPREIASRVDPSPTHLPSLSRVRQKPRFIQRSVPAEDSQGEHRPCPGQRSASSFDYGCSQRHRRSRTMTSTSSAAIGTTDASPSHSFTAPAEI